MHQSTQAKEILERMLLQEKSSTYAIRNYCSSYQELEDSIIDESCRTKMAVWIQKIINISGLTRCTLPVAMSYVDRIMSCRKSKLARRASCNKDVYQLLVITCMYIAGKSVGSRNTITGRMSPLPATLLLSLSKNRFSTADVEKMELLILADLDWHLCGPNVSAFVWYILMLMGERSDVLHDSLLRSVMLQAQFSTTCQALLSTPYSTVAVAAILNAANEDSSLLECKFKLCYVAKQLGVNPYSSVVEKTRRMLMLSAQSPAGVIFGGAE